jgi:hypothetical protein
LTLPTVASSSPPPPATNSNNNNALAFYNENQQQTLHTLDGVSFPPADLNGINNKASFLRTAAIAKVIV